MVRHQSQEDPIDTNRNGAPPGHPASFTYDTRFLAPHARWTVHEGFLWVNHMLSADLSVKCPIQPYWLTLHGENAPVSLDELTGDRAALAEFSVPGLRQVGYRHSSTTITLGVEVPFIFELGARHGERNSLLAPPTFEEAGTCDGQNNYRVLKMGTGAHLEVPTAPWGIFANDH